MFLQKLKIDNLRPEEVLLSPPSFILSTWAPLPQVRTISIILIYPVINYRIVRTALILFLRDFLGIVPILITPLSHYGKFCLGFTISFGLF